MHTQLDTNISAAPRNWGQSLTADAASIFSAAVRGAQTDQMLTRVDWATLLDRPLSEYRRVLVVGAGKASMALAGAVEADLGPRLRPGTPLEGVVVVPHGYRRTFPASLCAPKLVEVVEAGHPIPDEVAERTAAGVLERATLCGADDLVLVLISGGGTALWAAPPRTVPMADVQRTFELLLRSGADVHGINTVRKHLSRIGGGRLATAAYPATVRTLIISDVMNDDPSTIACGPTVADPSTAEDAIRVVRARGLWDRVPPSVRNYLERAVRSPRLATPKPGDHRFQKSRVAVLGANRDALAAARAEAERRGYEVRVVFDEVRGEAREVGRSQARAALATDPARAMCLLWGGGTTVTVRGGGRGGRNQELALAAALTLDGTDRVVTVLSGGTDGVDGSTDAAGAWATPGTAAAARAQGFDPQAYLEDNDAYPLFDAVGGLLRTGPTHTDTLDIQVALSRPRA